VNAVGKVLFILPALDRMKPRAVKALFRFGEHQDIKKDTKRQRREGKKALRKGEDL
jgi:hypothetical protein